MVPGVICLAIGAAVMVPAAVLVTVGVSRDLRIHRLLVEWGGLDRDPEGDMALRRPRASLLWLLTSFALCATGLFACLAVPANARAGVETYGLVAWLMGLGFLAWLTGLTGLVKAFAHRRGAAGAGRGGAGAVIGGVDSSASPAADQHRRGPGHPGQEHRRRVRTLSFICRRSSSGSTAEPRFLTVRTPT